MLSTPGWSYFPSTHQFQMLTRFVEFFFSFFVFLAFCLFVCFVFNVAKPRMMFDNCRKSKFVSGSLLLLLPLVILRKYIIDLFQQNVWYYMLDNKNNCPMNDSMKLCILDLLSCELALFSIVPYSLFYTFYVHFNNVNVIQSFSELLTLILWFKYWNMTNC